MKVICPDADKTCGEHVPCSHSKPHEEGSGEDFPCYDVCGEPCCSTFKTILVEAIEKGEVI